VSWAASWHWATALLPLALGPLIQAPFTLLGGRLLFDESVSVGDIASDLRARAWPSWIPSLAIAFAAFVGSVASCGVIAVSLLFLVFLPECALLERVDPRRGLRRSWRLSSGAPGGAIAGAIGRWVLAAWCASVAEASGQAVVSYIFQANLPIPSALDGFATPWVLLGLLASSPLWAIWRLMLYVDARTRVEGWDLQVGLRAAGLAR
jgi:hypothetical protein